MDVLRWFAGSDTLPRMEWELLWGWGTLVLSVLLAAGYAAIAFNWYVQRRVARSAEARRSARRLLLLAVPCVLCGSALFALDRVPLLVWRAYDVALLAMGVYTWSFVIRTRGLSLVDERLAEVQDLHRSVESYREMSEYLPHIVWTASGDGTVDFCNLRWKSYVGGPGTWLDVVHPEDEPRALAAWIDAVKRRQPLSLELRLRGVAGYRTFLLTATPIVRGATAVRWLGACADLEDQKQLIAERERQARQRAFMFNALGHDLRTPLNAVALNSQVLKMASRQPEILEAANAIADSALAAGALVTKLLEFAKVGAKDDNQLTRVSLRDVLEQIRSRFAPALARKRLMLHVAGDNFELYTDRMKLERILSNLIDNAIKYTNEGEIRIAAFRGGDDAAVILVSDTGVGVPDASRPLLFDEFYQVNNHERDQAKGFGMGLAICRCLARQLGGDVGLSSTGPGGSTFQLTVPAGHPRGGGRPAGAAGAVPDPEDAAVCSA